MTNPMSVDKEEIRAALEDPYQFIYRYKNDKIVSWLRALLAENEQLEQRTLDKSNGWGECEEQNRQLQEENKRLSGVEHTLWLAIIEADKQIQQLREELEHLPGWKVEIAELHSELAAKDKVLMHYADADQYETNGISVPILDEKGEAARSILFQYKGEIPNDPT